MAMPRLTAPTIAVLEALLAATKDAPQWSLRICMETDLGFGSVYPILDRLADLGWVTSWDETEPHPGRPARRYWQLSSEGREQARQALDARRARRRGARRPQLGGAQ